MPKFVSSIISSQWEVLTIANYIIPKLYLNLTVYYEGLHMQLMETEYISPVTGCLRIETGKPGEEVIHNRNYSLNRH